MRLPIATILVVAVVSILAGEVSPVLAQSFAAPTPVRPTTNGQGGIDAFATGVIGPTTQTFEAWISFLPVANATHYFICVTEVSGAQCLHQKQMFALSERLNPTLPPPSTGEFTFIVPVSTSVIGRSVQWRAQACSGPNPNNCTGAFSTAQTVKVLLPLATIAQGMTSTISNNRSVTFQWTNHPFADEGFQLIVLPNGPPQLSGFSNNNPTVAPPPGMSIQVPVNTTFLTLTLPANMPSIKWAVGQCRSFNGVRRCSQLYNSWRSMRVANFFGVALAPAFRHPRCINCHAVTADTFQNDVQNPPQSNPPGGLPSNHPSADATMNNQSLQDGQGCRTCHRDNLLPTQGNINPGWHAPSGMDFRGKSDAQLCQMAKAFPSAGAAFQHLNQDKLILWAVGKGTLPSGVVRPTAPPDSNPPNADQEILDWQRLIYSWHTAQQPCN